MKKRLTTIILFFPVLLFAQQKRGSFIKEHLYVKASPTLFFGNGLNEKDNNFGSSPAIFGTVGAKIRYVKKSKIMAIVGLSRLNSDQKTIVSVSPGPGGTYTAYSENQQNMPFIAVSLVL